MDIFFRFPFRHTLPKKLRRGFESQLGHSTKFFGRVRRKGKRKKDAHILICTFPFIGTFSAYSYFKTPFKYFPDLYSNYM